MTITARIVADSISLDRQRITTFILKYPRFIHSEFMTHRKFSRNASSSRAIPVSTMIRRVIQEPAMPVYWGANQAGMQAATQLTGLRLALAKQIWLKARLVAVAFVWLFTKLGLHKQIANRILEPWQHIEVVCTATDWDNFYALRDHPMAQPEIQELARVMLEAHAASTPTVLMNGEWHLPFITDEDRAVGSDIPDFLQKISAARCARVSYLRHDGTKAPLSEDLALYDRLMGGNPKHASPTEHQARPYEMMTAFTFEGEYRRCWSNVTGYMQFRKTIEGENVPYYPKYREAKK